MTDDVSAVVHTDVSRGDGATILSVRGDLDLRSTPGLVSSAHRILATPTEAKTLIIDVGGVTFCDSSGLTAFVQIRQQCSEAGWTFQLDQAKLPLLRVLDLTGLREYLNVVTDGSSPTSHEHP